MKKPLVLFRVDIGNDISYPISMGTFFQANISGSLFYPTRIQWKVRPGFLFVAQMASPRARLLDYDFHPGLIKGSITASQEA